MRRSLVVLMALGLLAYAPVGALAQGYTLALGVQRELLSTSVAVSELKGESYLQDEYGFLSSLSKNELFDDELFDYKGKKASGFWMIGSGIFFVSDGYKQIYDGFKNNNAWDVVWGFAKVIFGSAQIATGVVLP